MLIKKILFGFAIAFLAFSTTLVAQDAEEATKKKRDPAAKATAKIMKMFAKANLTDDQKTSAQAIVEKHIGSYLEARKTTRSLLTKDQIKLQKAAMKKGKADGLKKEELAAAGLAATGLTEAEQASHTEAKKKYDSISNTIHTEITSLLSDEQKAALPSMKKGKKAKDKKGKKRGKGKGKKNKSKDKDEMDENEASE